MADIKKHDKKVVIETSAGQKSFTGIRANAILNRLNDNPRFWHTTDDTEAEIYFDMESATCGMCLVATVTYTTETIDPIDCEDGIPNCPDATAEHPVEGYSAPVK